MALVDDIKAQIAKYQQNPFATKNASTGVKSIDSRDTANVIDALNQLNTKYGAQIANENASLAAVPAKYQGTLDDLSQQLGNAKTENQDTLNQNAVDEQTDLRRIIEQMANYGNTGGGQIGQLELQASANRENKDNAVYRQRTDDQNKITGQINSTKAQQQSDIDTINSAIKTLENQGEDDLASLLAQSSLQHQSDVQGQQAAEAQAAAEAEQAAQKLAEQQYEAQLAAQAKLDAAQIAHSSSGSSGSSGGSSGSSSNSSSDIGMGSRGDDVATIQSNLNSLGYNVGTVDGVFGNQTASALKKFQAAYGLKQSGVYDDQTAKMMASIASHLSDVASGQQTESMREAVGRGRTQ